MTNKKLVCFDTEDVFCTRYVDDKPVAAIFEDQRSGDDRRGEQPYDWAQAGKRYYKQADRRQSTGRREDD